VRAAVKLTTEGNVAALLASVGLHAALLLLPALAPWHRSSPPSGRPEALPNSVAMIGNSIEVEAPTPDFAAPAAAGPPPTADPVDVSSLPPEAPPSSPPVRAREPEGTPAAAPALAKPRLEPATKPRRPRPPSAAAPSTAAFASGDASAHVPASGTFGQEGLAPGVRRLGYGFARSIPPATKGDPAWLELPVGHVGTIRIELEVDANNRLGAVKRWQGRPSEPAPPAVLERLVERTLILMRAGQFALSGSNDPGSERLLIDVEVRDERADDDEDNRNVVQLKFDAATPGHPNKAYFRYGTGRAVEAKVTTVRSGK